MGKSTLPSFPAPLQGWIASGRMLNQGIFVILIEGGCGVHNG
jgi:hypothetical protein